MYILLALLTTVSAYTVWRLMRGLGGWMLYGLSTLLALYTHYLAGCVVLVENLIVLGWGLKRRQSLFRAQWLGTQVALVTLFAPWLPVALYQARFHRMTWARPPTAEIVRDALILMALGDSGVRGGEALSVAGLGSALLAVVWLVWRAHRAGRAGAYGFLLLWLGLPFGMMVAASQVYPLFHAKQLLMLLVPLLLLVAGALTELPWVPRWMLAGVLAFFVIGSLGDLYGSDTKHGWRETAGHIEMHYQPGDLLYLNPAAGMLALKPYLHRALPYDGYPPEYDVVRGGWQGEQVTASIAAHAMAALPDTYRRVWLIEFGPTFWDPEGHLAAWLELHGQLVGEWSFQGVRARLYGLAPGSGP